jgi:hypothetical protein
MMKPILNCVFGLCIATIACLSACSKTEKNNTAKAKLQISLTDDPDPSIQEVWIDVQQIEVLMDGSGPVILNGSHPGLYNLLDLANGKDTLLADAELPPGNISQIRLILGDNNFLVTRNGDQIALKTPSEQQSGLKVQVHQEITGGILYHLTIDFNVAKSIVFAGNSGNVILKPVLRILSFVPSGGDISGIVVPAGFPTFVYAIMGADTVSTTVTNSHGNFLIKDVPAGQYTLLFNPGDTSYVPFSTSFLVTLGQVSVVDTVKLHN